MTTVSRNWILLFVLALAISACTTPLEVRKGAELSAAQLGVLQASLQNFVKASNSDVAQRTERLKEQFASQQRLSGATEDALYVGLADEKAMKKFHADLVALADRFQEREIDAEAAARSFSEELAGLTHSLAISGKSFKKTQQALAKLADEEDVKTQFELGAVTLIYHRNN